jgi:hypothetical protein
MPPGQPGYLMLLSVLIAGAIITAMVMAVTFWGVDHTQTAITDVRFTQAKALSNACAEEALERLHEKPPYTGSGFLNSFTFGGCTYTTINTSGTNYTINSTGSSTNAISRVQIIITKIQPKIIISTWQEVPSF